MVFGSKNRNPVNVITRVDQLRETFHNMHFRSRVMTCMELITNRSAMIHVDLTKLLTNSLLKRVITLEAD